MGMESIATPLLAFDLYTLDGKPVVLYVDWSFEDSLMPMRNYIDRVSMHVILRCRS